MSSHKIKAPYKRWFPVNHDINRDPDMRELRKEHGDKAILVWLELLSIADRNEGYVPGRLSLLSLTIGGLIGLKPLSVANVVGWLSHRRKIVYHNGGGLDRSRYIANWAKYHRTQKPIYKDSETNVPDTEPSEPSEPSLIKESSLPPLPASPALSKDKPDGKLSPWVKEAADRIYTTDPRRFAKLVVWTKAAQKQHSEEVIVATLNEFYPYRTSISDWYPYLDRIANRVHNEQAIGKAEKVGNAYKDGRMEGIGSIMGHLAAK